MKPRHFLIVALVGGCLLLFSQIVFAMPVLVSNYLSKNQSSQNEDSGHFRPIVESGDCGERTPAGQVRNQDLTPLMLRGSHPSYSPWSRISSQEKDYDNHRQDLC